MTEPLRLAFEVACTVDHAFATWTQRISSWWPADHTVSGAPSAVIFEGRVGGRIYERTEQGEELDWGVVTGWDPPAQLSYRWHLGAGPEVATEVEIRFTGLDQNKTRVEISQVGWERLGAAGPELRRKNQFGWESLLPLARLAMEKGDALAQGTKEDPWQLKTPPGSSEYTMYKDETADPPQLICQVGSTKLMYQLRAIDDLQAWLKTSGDWVPLGAADEQKTPAEGSVEAWGRAQDNPVGGWYGLRKGYRGRFGMYLPPLLEELGLAEVTHDARNNKMRAKP
jgi:hypothetical protein